jgi:hypothetical protein
LSILPDDRVASVISVSLRDSSGTLAMPEL